jgi:hypothetical protein
MHNVIDPAANGKCGEEEGSEKTDWLVCCGMWKIND